MGHEYFKYENTKDLLVEMEVEDPRLRGDLIATMNERTNCKYSIWKIIYVKYVGRKMNDETKHIYYVKEYDGREFRYREYTLPAGPVEYVSFGWKPYLYWETRKLTTKH